ERLRKVGGTMVQPANHHGHVGLDTVGRGRHQVDLIRSTARGLLICVTGFRGDIETNNLCPWKPLHHSERIVTAAGGQIRYYLVVQIETGEQDIVDKLVAKGHGRRIVVVPLVVVMDGFVVLLLAKRSRLLAHCLVPDPSRVLAPRSRAQTQSGALRRRRVSWRG